MHYKGKAGHYVTLNAGGAQVKDYFVPASSPNKPAIIMVHEWWGLNDYIKREAERLHERTGYAVLAVDLYHGKVATNPQDAGKYMQAVNEGDAAAGVNAAVAALKKGIEGYKAKKIGSVGWCFGGGWSFQTALRNPKSVQACVIYYGMPETDPAKLTPLKAPVLMFWGKRDNWINQDVVIKFQTAAKEAHKNVEAHGYDADHAFANPSNPKYDRAAATDAMNRTLGFFKKHLG